MWEPCIWYVSFRLPHIILLFITTCGNSVYGMYHLGCHILFHCSLQHVGTLSLWVYINEAAICHGGESRDLNDRVHGILYGIRTKQVNKTYHNFLNTQPIFIKQSTHTS